MHWWCGRCKTRVKYSPDVAFKKHCECTKGPSPWWRVPDTWWEKLQCSLGKCKYKGICSKCNEEHYRNHRDDV